MGDRTETDDATDGSRRIGAREGPQPQLFVVFERSRLLAGGARHSLANVHRVTLGRGQARISRRFAEGSVPTLELRLPDRQISRVHACLESRSGDWLVRDCGSANGTRVNGRRVEEARLGDGDVLELGHTLFRFRRAMLTPFNAPGDVESSELRGLAAHVGTLFCPGHGTGPREPRSVGAIRRVDTPRRGDRNGKGGAGARDPRRVRAHRRVRRRQLRSLAPPPRRVLAARAQEGRILSEPVWTSQVSSSRCARRDVLFLDEIGDMPASSQAALLRGCSRSVRSFLSARPDRSRSTCASLPRPTDRCAPSVHPDSSVTICGRGLLSSRTSSLRCATV